MRAIVCVALFAALAGVALSSPAVHRNAHRHFEHTAGDHPFDGQVSWAALKALLMRGVDDSAPHTFFKGLMHNVAAHLPASVKHRSGTAGARAAARAAKAKAAGAGAGADPSIGPWFGWIPVYAASSVPASEDGTAPEEATADASNSWSAPCFANNTLTSTLTTNAAGQVTGATLTLTATNPKSLLCSDWYLIGTLDGVVIKTMDALAPGPNVISYSFSASASAAEVDDVRRNGFRVFRFLNDVGTTLSDLYDTVMLFLPAMATTGPVPDGCAQDNLAFLKQYVAVDMEPRNVTVVDIDEGLVQSGDLFGIIRLDGLDPMLAWAMGGSHTGHTTVAMRAADGTLHVCESTTKDNYWPTNGIQCTAWQQWLAQAVNADYNVVWLPLSGASRAVFNATAAWQYVAQDLNLNYGFGNLLWGWVDTVADNYPYPLTWQLHELLPAWLGHISPPTSDLLWNQAFNFRLGTAGLGTADLYQRMASQGLSFGEMVSLPERDSWLYSQTANDNTTVHGHSSVCDVFVCRVWKTAGLFGDTDFQCTEATNWDVYSLDIFEANQQRPPQCVEADPTLPFCQLTGKYRLTLPFYNSRAIATNSFNDCPRGSPPDWNKPFPC